MRRFILTALICLASWYSTEACQFNPDPKCPTADGSSLYELERKGELYAASWYYPLGTKVKVTNQANGRSVVVVIRDRNAIKKYPKRIIDLSRNSFQAIGNPRDGILRVELEQVA